MLNNNLLIFNIILINNKHTSFKK